MPTKFLLKVLIFVAVSAATVADTRAETGKVLVFGGTGMIGYEIVKALKEQNQDVTVFVRASSNVDDLRKIGVPHVIGDVLEPETLHRVLGQGAYETVISSISRSGAFGVVDGVTIHRDGVTIHRTGNNNITAAALLGGVQHLILMGTVGAGDSAGTLSERQRSRFGQIYQDKTAAEDFLRASGLTYTVVRTGVILTDEPTGKVELTEDHTIRHAANIFDFAKATASCVGNAQCFDKVFHTHDPSIPPLSPEDLQKAYEGLARFEAARRGKGTQ